MEGQYRYQFEYDEFNDYNVYKRQLILRLIYDRARENFARLRSSDSRRAKSKVRTTLKLGTGILYGLEVK